MGRVILVILLLVGLAGTLEAQNLARYRIGDHGPCRETADVALCNRVAQLEHRVTALEDSLSFYKFLQGEVVNLRVAEAQQRLIIGEFGRLVFMRLLTHERLFEDMGWQVFKTDTTTKE